MEVAAVGTKPTMEDMMEAEQIHSEQMVAQKLASEIEKRLHDLSEFPDGEIQFSFPTQFEDDV